MHEIHYQVILRTVRYFKIAVVQDTRVLILPIIPGLFNRLICLVIVYT